MCAVARGDTGRGAPVWQREPAPPPRCPLPSFLPRVRAGRARSRSALSGTGADRGGQRDRLQVGRPGAPGECLFPARFGSAHSPSRFVFFFPTFNLILKEKLSQQLSMLLIQCLTKSFVLLYSSARRVELFQHKNSCKVSFYPWSRKNVHRSSAFFNFSFTNLNKGMLYSSMSCTDHWILYFAVGSGND